ncbi:alpha/beta-hydrolase [Saccharata proteae CBS 121410]|uniref:Alpha/beta-hydrolase n=1 Tax=Saccharata proteae CBS 121410 TaxID=1314787 RepID=A0A9P4HNQ7_9PEZI|nr:alpha/beta-hydrolase [Saccharata proteae CBS 121410]
MLMVPIIPIKDYQKLVEMNGDAGGGLVQATFGLASRFQYLPSTATPNIQCANFTVPLDWNNRHEGTITLGLNKLPASDPENRIGSVIYTPSGPGGVATQSIESAAAAEALGLQVFTSGVRKHFDLIGLDPRGVGKSTPVRCNATLYNERVSIFPTDASSFEKLVEHNKALGKSCLEMTGHLLAHIDTVSVARDMEAVRVALNDGKLNFLGESYGSQIGATYAEMYPHSIRAMALDGIVDHTQDKTSSLVGETWTYENELTRFAEWCANTTPCALQSVDVLALFDNLTTTASKTPIPAPGCVKSGLCRADVNGEELRLNVQSQLTIKDSPKLAALDYSLWADLATALLLASRANATALSTTIAVSDPDAQFPSLAVGCLDWLRPSTLADLTYKAALTRLIAPHTRGHTQSYLYQSAYIGWPIPVTNPQQYLRFSGNGTSIPILLAQSLHDPETSYIWANSVYEQIPGAVLVTRGGDGHTSYILGGETARAMDEYLVDGVLPERGTVFET